MSGSSSLLAPARVAHAAPIFAALGDPTRLQIVARLCSHGPQSIVALTEHASITRQALTKHLHTLASAGLVQGSRAGRMQLWELRPERLDDARGYLDQISREWDRALARLRDLVEGD